MEKKTQKPTRSPFNWFGRSKEKVNKSTPQPQLWFPQQSKSKQIKTSSTTFWNPLKNTKQQSKQSNPNFLNFGPRQVSTSPVKLGQYNVRTKREIKIIDRDPWGDKDRDGVVNWLDCRPSNKKKKESLTIFKEGKPYIMRAIGMQKIPEKIKNTKIENIEQFNKIRSDINNITASTFHGKKTVQPDIYPAIVALSNKGYPTRASQSVVNNDFFGQRIILDKRLPQPLIDELNTLGKGDVNVRVSPDASATVISYSQKGKSIAESQKRILDYINKIPMAGYSSGYSPNITISQNIQERLRQKSEPVVPSVSKIEPIKIKSEMETPDTEVSSDVDNSLIEDLKSQFRFTGVLEDEIAGNEAVSPVMSSMSSVNAITKHVKGIRTGRGRPSKLEMMKKKEDADLANKIRENWEASGRPSFGKHQEDEPIDETESMESIESVESIPESSYDETNETYDTSNGTFEENFEEV